MPFFVIPKRRTVRPIGSFVPNRSFPLSIANLYVFGSDGQNRCYVTGNTVTLESNFSKNTLRGLEWGSAGFPSYCDLAFAPIQNFTIVVGHQLLSGVVSWMVGDKWDGVYADTNSSTFKVTKSSDFSGLIQPTPKFPVYVDIFPTFSALTIGGTNDLRGSCQGGEVAADTSVNVPATSGTLLRIGTDGGGTNSSSGVIKLFALLRGTASNALLQSLSGNPWQLFEESRRFYFVPSVGGGTTWNDRVDETASAADTPTAVSTRLVDTAETASATDTPTAVSTRVADVTETASASDTPDATTGATPGIVAETASAADTPTAVSTRIAAVAETASATDTPTAVSTRLASVAEICSGAESTDGVVVPAGANVCAETASATDTVSCLIVTTGSIAEGTASATDVCSVVGIWSAFVAETASAVDRPTVAGEVAAPAASRTWMIPFEDRTLYVYQDNQ